MASFMLVLSEKFQGSYKSTPRPKRKFIDMRVETDDESHIPNLKIISHIPWESLLALRSENFETLFKDDPLKKG